MSPDMFWKYLQLENFELVGNLIIYLVYRACKMCKTIETEKDVFQMRFCEML
jgi:hypothetical protein